MENYLILPKISDQSLLATYYSLADIFAICSKRENFPTTCVEAQCCGAPVVGFDEGGIKETSVKSEDDFVSYGDIDKLKKKTLSLLKQSHSGIAERAHKLYSKETMTKSYMDEYDKGGKKQKILLIDVNCKGSSTGKIVYDLYSDLRKDGRDAYICYGRGELIEEDNIYKFGLDWETKIHAGLSRITGYNACFSPISTKRLIKRIKKIQPDIIHIHELHAYFVNIKPLLRYIQKKDIPLIWTFHCEYMYTGKCGHAYECSNFQKECGNCLAVKDYPKSIFFDKTKQMLRTKKELLRDMDFTIVTPSIWLADRVKMSFLKDKEIKVIHNGIDTTIFCPTNTTELRKKHNIPEDYKIALAVAPDIMSDRKGGKWVLKLAESLKDEKIFFILIGGVITPDDIPSNAIIAGEVRKQELLAQYYSLADCLLLFSECETYSMTCAEALCCGTSVIGFKCGDPKTVFNDITAKPFDYGDLDGVRGDSKDDEPKRTRVSVAMAVWNGEKYIRSQIDSILEMLDEKDEIVISYDKSDDNTLDIIQEYARSHQNIKIVYDKGRSVEENFNNAVKHCSGKYIFLADQDDIWIENKIDKMVSLFESDSDIKVIICDGFISDETLNINGSLFEELSTTANPLRNFIKGTYLGCQMAFSSDIKNKIWPVKVNPPLPHDLWLGVKGAQYGKVVLLPEKLIIHRIHAANYSNTSKMSMWGVIKNRLIFMKEIIKRR